MRYQNREKEFGQNGKGKNNYGRFLLLCAGELVSSIGSGLTAFGMGVGTGAGITVCISGICLVIVAAAMLWIKPIHGLEHPVTEDGKA